jgi:3-phenylpropionate/cinnamic acid dioxygenase small subunit
MAAVLPSSVRHEVADVLVRYATGIDRREWDLFRTCFTEDCEADYGDIGIWHGVEAVTAWMEETHAACGTTRHEISNIAVAPHEEGVSAHSDIDALVMGPDDTSGTQATGSYEDVLVYGSDGWRIARRRFTLVSMRPVTGLAGL